MYRLRSFLIVVSVLHCDEATHNEGARAPVQLSHCFDCRQLTLTRRGHLEMTDCGISDVVVTDTAFIIFNRHS